jgi:nicotinate phosphoribosyltransferase
LSASTPPSTALFTDRYELTMLEAALAAGVAETPAVFEVFTRALPPGRRFGVFAGLQRLVELIEAFHFGPEELSFLEEEKVVKEPALSRLSRFCFTGHIDAYAEGELYTAGSPVLTVEAPFVEALLLETLVLSVLNHDSAVAAAAQLLVEAAAGRPIIEMGSRRVDPEAAVAAARAAYLGGFASTSNLEAGRRYGMPSAGTVAHAFMLLFESESDAFDAQVRSMGPASTILVDTFDMEEGIRRAVKAAGPGLAAIRIDSGDLVAEAQRARSLLDSLGAVGTRIVATGELDVEALRALACAPVDAYGVGTAVVTGLGAPTCGFVYKPVEIAGRPVAKASPGKSTRAGRRWAWRVGDKELLSTAPAPAPEGGRALQRRVVSSGRRLDIPSVHDAREHHRQVLAELPAASALRLVERSSSLP